MRWTVVGLAGILVACRPMQKIAVEATFDADSTRIRCVEATGGTCQVDFRGDRPQHASIAQGATGQFAIGAGTPFCLEASARGLTGCQPTSLVAGKSHIRKSQEHG